MEKLANKFTFLEEEDEDSKKVGIIESTTLTKVEEKQKRPLEHDVKQGSSKKKKSNKTKLFKERIGRNSKEFNHEHSIKRNPVSRRNNHQITHNIRRG